jgi:hypothetical protein
MEISLKTSKSRPKTPQESEILGTPLNLGVFSRVWAKITSLFIRIPKFYSKIGILLVKYSSLGPRQEYILRYS